MDAEKGVLVIGCFGGLEEELEVKRIQSTNFGVGSVLVSL